MQPGDTEEKLVVISREFKEKAAVAKQHKHNRIVQSVGNEILLFFIYEYYNADIE